MYGVIIVFNLRSWVSFESAVILVPRPVYDLELQYAFLKALHFV